MFMDCVDRVAYILKKYVFYNQYCLLKKNWEIISKLNQFFYKTIGHIILQVYRIQTTKNQNSNDFIELRIQFTEIEIIN